MSRALRPLAAVPRWVVLGLALSLGAQLCWQMTSSSRVSDAPDPPHPPGAQALRLASFGEHEAASRLAMVYIQSYPSLDSRLLGWLRAALETDPLGQYPLFLAARVYAETADTERARMALEFVYQGFLRDPNRRWRWLAHAALLAKHRLKDMPLARRYAQALERNTTAREIPAWARQMEIFILEDMNELEAAKIMIASLLQSGLVHDPAELRFLIERLEALEAKSGR